MINARFGFWLPTDDYSQWPKMSLPLDILMTKYIKLKTIFVGFFLEGESQNLRLG